MRTDKFLDILKAYTTSSNPEAAARTHLEHLHDNDLMDFANTCQRLSHLANTTAIQRALRRTS